jgi:hypothetical protein
VRSCCRAQEETLGSGRVEARERRELDTRCWQVPNMKVPLTVTEWLRGSCGDWHRMASVKWWRERPRCELAGGSFLGVCLQRP